MQSTPRSVVFRPEAQPDQSPFKTAAGLDHEHLGSNLSGVPNPKANELGLALSDQKIVEALASHAAPAHHSTPAAPAVYDTDGHLQASHIANGVAKSSTSSETIAHTAHDADGHAQASHNTHGSTKSITSSETTTHAAHGQHTAHGGHAVAHHVAHGHSGHAAAAQVVAHEEKLTGAAALSAALSDHMSQHGMADEAKSYGHQVGNTANGYLAGAAEPNATFAIHKDGQVLASVYGEGAHDHSPGDPPALRSDTLTFVRDHGMPKEGLAVVRENLSAETRGMSDLDLVEKLGGATLEKVGHDGLDMVKLALVQDHVNQTTAGTGFDTYASKLDSLKTMVDMESHADKNYLALDSEKGTAKVMSLDEFAQHSASQGAENVVAVDLHEVKQTLGMEATSHSVEAVRLSDASAHQDKAVAQAEAHQPEMSV